MATDVSQQQTPSLPDDPLPPPVPRESWASDEERAAFVQRVLDAITGKVPAEPLVTPPIVKKLLADLKREQPIASAKFLRLTEDDWNLQYYFGGERIGTLQTPKGTAVVAHGWTEIRALLDGLPKHLTGRFTIDCPHPWDYLGNL